MSELSDKDIQAMKAELRARYEKYAARKGYRLNPNEETVDATLYGLVMRKAKFGKYYCPCKVLTGDPAQDKRLICPCADHREEIERDGICTCRLLVAEDYREE